VFDLEIKRAELEMKREEHAMKMREQSVSMSHKEAEHGMRIEEHGIKAEKPGKDKDGKPTMGPLSAAIANIGESHKALVQALNDQNKQAGKPKRIRGPSGKVYQIEQD
jgi:acetylornithine/succinyldiaminopimelate/putrescine aminotransferase